MNNKSFIQRLAQTTGYTQDDCQKMVYSMVDAMNQRFQEGENVLLPGFGTFEVKKRMERIIINPNTRQRLLQNFGCLDFRQHSIFLSNHNYMQQDLLHYKKM